MAKLLTILVLVMSICYSFGQQRIGFDFSSQLTNINTTLNYQRVLKERLLFSSGFSFGRYGRSELINSHTQFANGFRYSSPFREVNQPISDYDGTEMNLYEYYTKTRGMYVQVGVGYFHEFGVVHGLRFNTHFKLGFMKSYVLAGYWNDSITVGALRSYSIRHWTAAISPELFHTIRLGGRTTLYYGMKLPYYFPIQKNKFNPNYSKDMFNYWEPEISIGLTYIIGKRD